MSELPKEWAIASLKELVAADGLFSDGDWIESKDQDPNGENRLLQLADIGDGFFINKSSRFVNNEKFQQLNCTELHEGDLLIARMPDPLGRACLMPKSNQRCLTVVDVAVFRSGSADISHKLLMYFINSPALRKTIEVQSSGTTRRRISRGKLADLKIPVPPAAEQIRITQRLDELLTHVDTLKARIDAIPTLLKRFRQSVLAAAISGRLTEEWRVQSFGSACEDKPAGWLPMSLPDLGELARGKSKHRPRNDERLFGGKYPFIQTGEVANSAGRIKTAKVFYSDFGLAQSRLFPKGTLCITIAANIADTAILDLEACFPDSVVGFVADEGKCCAQFIKYLVDVNKQNLEAFAPATAQKNINLKVLNELVFPMPPLAEQSEIVRRVEQFFAFADQMEAKVASAKSRIDHLTQSILAKAFRGELLPQDPNDEPASVLLERIAASKFNKSPKSRQLQAHQSTRPSKKNNSMSKHRQDEDVLGQPYLAEHLRRLDSKATSEVLFKVAELPVADFYKQLAWEVAQGLVVDLGETLEAKNEA